MTISCRDHIQDWSIARALPSVTHDTAPYFLVNGGQDFHGLLLQGDRRSEEVFFVLNFVSHRNESGLLRPVIFLALH